MYDEDNYSYKIVQEKIIILVYMIMIYIIYFIVFVVVKDIYNYICIYLKNFIFIVFKFVFFMKLQLFSISRNENVF